MAIFKCPDCEKKISVSALSCPKCGHIFAPNEISQILAKKKNGITVISILTIILVLSFSLLGN